MALLIGFVLDQQVTVQKAFSGPFELQRRVGTIEAADIVALDAADLEAAFRAPPALHRFPADMARRTRELCAVIVEHYGGEPARSGPRPWTAPTSRLGCWHCRASAP